MDNLILNQLQYKLKRTLTYLEIEYVKHQVQKLFSKTKPTKEYVQNTIDILYEDLYAGNINERLQSMVSMQKKSILDGSITSNTYTSPTNTIPCEISSIFGTSDRRTLQYLFNPAVLYANAYFLLDRKYVSQVYDNNRFQWNFNTSKRYSQQNTVTTMADVKNIVMVKCYPFRFPSTERIITFNNRISLFIEEFATQAFMANDHNRKFQFLFSITSVGNDYELQEANRQTSEYWFANGAIQEISSITISFGNPFRTLILDPDRLPATISATNVQTLLTFTQPHNVADGTIITITSFTTDRPIDDSVEIELMNDEDGWEVITSTATTLTINVDISGLVGNIINNPYEIYFESKRFVIPMQLKYLNAE